MTQLYRHPLLMQCHKLSQMIEECGASEELTRAVVAAGDLLESIDKHLDTTKNVITDEYLETIHEKIENLYIRPTLENYSEAINFATKKL